ncbi:MAG: hypothetical protein M5F18_11715 [Asgard group archaeon]|nr:hypothetical protein [Asgard group archaeon]
MTCLFDLPPEIIEKIVLNIPSKNIPRDVLPPALLYLSTENYCRYILGGMFIACNPNHFDCLYINVFSRDISLTENKNYRIVDKYFAESIVLSSNFNFLSIPTPLIRVWTGVPDLIIPLDLSVTNERTFNDYKNEIISRLSTEDYKKLELFRWERNSKFLYSNSRYFKQHDVKYIKNLKFIMDDTTNYYHLFYPLKPEILTIAIESKRRVYSGYQITTAIDLANVVKFKLECTRYDFTISGWNAIYEELKRVREFNIDLGFIVLPDFVPSRKKSISSYNLTLFGSTRFDYLDTDVFRKNILSSLQPALADDACCVVTIIHQKRHIHVQSREPLPIEGLWLLLFCFFVFSFFYFAVGFVAPK